MYAVKINAENFNPGNLESRRFKITKPFHMALNPKLDGVLRFFFFFYGGDWKFLGHLLLAVGWGQFGVPGWGLLGTGGWPLVLGAVRESECSSLLTWNGSPTAT